MNKKYFALIFLLLSILSVLSVQATPARPNIIIILADDLGYGDLSIQGHPLIRTPTIDRLAREGQRWTSFYASAPICNPSRVALMTGRMPIRIHQNGKNQWQTMPASEVTLGELLKNEGYATGYIGKWGITNFEQGLHPNEQGFDYFYGLPGSNDPLPEGMARTYENVKNAESNVFPTALYRQREIIETPAEQSTLTKRYTEESVKWINAHKDGPFLLYLAHTMPHVPIFASSDFQGSSKAGLYGDVIEELDWSVGQVLKVLEKAGLADNTLIFISSDNGPWLTYYDLGGSPGLLRDGKMTSWEGGFRVPGIFWWPGKIKPGVIDGIGVNVDLMSTIATLTDAPLPSGKQYDSIDLSPTLLNGQPSPRNEWFFYAPTGNLWAARKGDYKLVYESQESIGKDNITNETTEESFLADRGYGNHKTYDPPLLFDLTTDISERLDISDQNPNVVMEIQQAVDMHRRTLSEHK